MKFSEIKAKGLARCLAAPGLAPDQLHLHITELEPAKRPHAQHTHAGVEVFYMLEGLATIEVEDELYPLGPNEAIMVDASHPHSILNSGSARARYLVISTQ
jgi:mannose-6-phosphate isomerase-like protein (cupin superfamily)